MTGRGESCCAIGYLSLRFICLCSQAPFFGLEVGISPGVEKHNAKTKSQDDRRHQHIVLALIVPRYGQCTCQQKSDRQSIDPLMTVSGFVTAGNEIK